MTAFERMYTHGHEAVLFCADPPSGLRAFIAIHDTTLGPALGGCRIKPYGSEDEALEDALRLSRAMTYKSAMAGLDLGGGKTVVMLDDPSRKTPELLRALAWRINLLRGTYIGAGDIGSNTQDLRLMRETTKWVTGLAREDGGLGDSAILTALGVFTGIRAAVKERLGAEDLRGLRVAVQGAGKVGFKLLEYLTKAGCDVWLADVNTDAVNYAVHHFPQVRTTTADAILDVDADVFSPNAVGGIISPETIDRLKVSVVAGGANNVLSDDSLGLWLKERNILYTPDFAINCGGVIMVACEIEGLGFDVAKQRTEAVYDRLNQVFTVAREEGVSTVEAAYLVAGRRIDDARTAGTALHR